MMKDKVVCKICGIEKKVLTQHLSTSHSLNKEEYKKEYPDASIVCESTSKKRSKAAIDQWNNLNEREQEQKIKKLYTSGQKRLKELRKNPDFCNKISNKVSETIQKKMKENPEYRTKLKKQNSEKSKKWWDSLSKEELDNLKTQRAYEMKKWWNETSEEILNKRNKKLSIAMVDRWKDIEGTEEKEQICNKIAESVADYWESLTPEERTALLDKLSFKTYNVKIGKDKYSFRSKLEIKAAEYFFENGFEFEYESLFIPYNHMGRKRNYIPDFYLPNYNLIVEVKSEYTYKEDIDTTKMQSTKSLGYYFEYLYDFDNLPSILNKYSLNSINRQSAAKP